MSALECLQNAMMSTKALPDRVRAGRAIWRQAFEEMRNHPRVRELYGCPLAAAIEEPNFLFRGVPVVLDEELQDDFVACDSP